MKPTALFLSLYMLVGSFIPRTDFSQLVHLGDLRDHYLAHKAAATAKNQQITFTEFCYIHFIDNSQHSEENHEEDHQKLPFQSINSMVILGVTSSSLTLNPKSQTNFSSLQFYVSPFHLMGFEDATYLPPNC